MNITYSVVAKRPRLLLRLTGLTTTEFDRLLEPFAAQYDKLVLQPRLMAKNRKRAAGGGQKGALLSSADKLLFILMYTRIYPLLIVQGMFFGMAESKACKWVGILLPVLDAALGKEGLRPKRARGRSLEEIIKEFPELVEMGVIIDGTERPIRRPKDKAKQKEAYSGKKKKHTKKHVTLVHPGTQYILAVSNEYNGRVHDKKILDEQKLTCNTELELKADTGFIGYDCGEATVTLPHKKQRKKKGEPKDKLTDDQKAANHLLASKRVAVEHSNAGFKRNRSVSDVLRNTRDGMSDQLTIVAMGLHNLRVTMRASYQNQTGYQV
jgi:hypothetical protein